MSLSAAEALAPLPPTGWLDLHCHLLPGIDDGCRSLAEALACVRQLQKHNFTGSVCTPHIWPRQFPDNVPVKIERFVARLNEHLQEQGFSYPLWAGGEVRMDEDTIAGFEEHGVPTLGPSRCVLIDFWGQTWPDCCDQVIDYLFQHSYQPILAHPERMNFREDELEELLPDLRARGVWLQGNLNSLSGGEGPLAQQRMRRWLQLSWYDMAATDTHAPGQHLAGRMRGIAQLQQEVGEQETERLLRQQPRRVLCVGTPTG